MDDVAAGFRNARVDVAGLPDAGDVSLEAVIPSYTRDAVGTKGAVGIVVAVAAAAILGVALVHGRWRHWGWVTDDEVVHIGSGLLGRRRETFRLDRVQHVTVRRTPYQRRHGLASLVISLADGDRHVPFLHQEDAAALASLALFTTETRPHRELSGAAPPGPSAPKPPAAGAESASATSPDPRRGDPTARHMKRQ